MDKNFIALLSGVDSFVAAKICLDRGMQGEAVYFEYGQPHREVLAVAKLANKLLIPFHTAALDIEMHRKDSAPYYPFRNAILIAMVANILAAQTSTRTIVTGMGTMSSGTMEGYPDTSSQFTAKLMDSLNEGVYEEDEIEILNPVMQWSRPRIFRWLIDNNFKSVIKMTSSCYEGENKKFYWGTGCDICSHCISRQADVDEAYLTIKGKK